MLREIDNNSDKKRTLQKVRRSHLTKKADSEKPRLIDPATHYLQSNKSYILHEANGLVEKNRKICIGTQYLNPYYRISDLTIEQRSKEKIITLNICIDHDNERIPWEYTIKRLESYGDLDLALWARRISQYYENYPNAMSKCIELLHSNEPEVCEELKRVKFESMKACQEIESKYAYYRVVHYFNEEKTQLISFSYNERFLREIGYTTEGFLCWAKKNGIPAIFDSNCPIYVELIKKFLECNLMTIGFMIEGPEYETFVETKKGTKEKVIVQAINVLEPLSEGFLLYGYFVLKSSLIEPKEGMMLKNEALIKHQVSPNNLKQSKPSLVLKKHRNHFGEIAHQEAEGYKQL